MLSASIKSQTLFRITHFQAFGSSSSSSITLFEASAIESRALASRLSLSASKAPSSKTTPSLPPPPVLLQMVRSSLKSFLLWKCESDNEGDLWMVRIVNGYVKQIIVDSINGIFGVGSINEWKLLVFWLLGSCVLGLGGAAWAAKDNASYEQHVHAECRFTRYPNLCIETLSTVAQNYKDDILSDLVYKSISGTKLTSTGHTSPRTIPPHIVASFDYCSELMSMSIQRLNQSLLALKKSPRKYKHDIQTWLSAAITFQQTCKEELGMAKTKAKGKANAKDEEYYHHLLDNISQKMDYLSQLVSNPLALVNRISGMTDHVAAEEEEVKKDMFPTWVSARDRKLLLLETKGVSVKANAVVAKDGTGNYATISEAIKAASGNRFVIYVKSGVYNEKIRTNKYGITLIGDGKYSTVIVSSSSSAGGTSMPDTATFTITGDGFIARDIGFHNGAGPQGEQALALNIASDHSVMYRCSIAGYQDTLYAVALRQFYRDCDIYGTIDFIFGNAAAVIQNCNLVLRRPHGGSYNVILANGRTDPGQKTGFSVHKCRITAGADFGPVKNSYKSYLGRPWKEYSRSVVMETSIEDAITGRGWIEWPGTGSSRLKTLYFAEYENMGPGAAGARVQWPGFHLIGSEEATKFTVANFISGTSWIPSTGVTFISGLH